MSIEYESPSAPEEPVSTEPASMAEQIVQLRTDLADAQAQAEESNNNMLRAVAEAPATRSCSQKLRSSLAEEMTSIQTRATAPLSPP